jgi:hypothetical protein
MKLRILIYLFYLARIDDNDPGYEHDRWMKRKKPTEDSEELRADRWYYKNMDDLLDNPEQSGIYHYLVCLVNISYLLHLIYLYIYYFRSFSNKCVD